MTKIFDKTCYSWDKRYEYNLMFLKAKVQYMQDRLENEGYLFTRDVCIEMGLPVTKSDVLSGWIDKDRIQVDMVPLSNGAIQLEFNCKENIFDSLSF